MSFTSNEVYVPIHVGRISSLHKREMEEMTRDDTGDNISEKRQSGLCSFYKERAS